MAIVSLIAVVGWLTVFVLFVRLRRHRCPIDPPTRAVLLNASGLPESCRTLRGSPPITYSRPHGKGPADTYRRIGTAAVYQVAP